MTAICISLLYLSQKKIQISQSAHVSINLYIAFQFSYLLLTKYWIVFLLPYKNWQMSLGSALPLQMAIIDTRTVKVIFSARVVNCNKKGSDRCAVLSVLHPLLIKMRCLSLIYYSVTWYLSYLPIVKLLFNRKVAMVLFTVKFL